MAPGETQSCTGVKLTNAGGADLTKPGATGIRTVEQNNGPGGTGNGLVPPVPFGSMVDELLLAASARTRWVTERIASLSNGSRGKGPESKDEITGSSCALPSALLGSSV